MEQQQRDLLIIDQQLQEVKKKERERQLILQHLQDEVLIFQQLPKEEERESLQERLQQLLVEVGEELNVLLYMLLVLAAGNELHPSLKRCGHTIFFLFFNLLIGWHLSLWNFYKPFFSLLCGCQ